MKLYLFLSALLLTIAMAGCDNKTGSNTPPTSGGANPGLSFSCIRCPLSVAKSFISSNKKCNNLVFNWYYSSTQASFQMVGYGEYQSGDTTRYLPLPYTPFPIFDSTNAQKTFNNFALGNLSISTDTVSQIITYAAQTGGDMLLFVPDSEPSNYLHARYRMYLTQFDSVGKPMNRIIPLDPLFGQKGINLNPCPPAHSIDFLL